MNREEIKDEKTKPSPSPQTKTSPQTESKKTWLKLLGCIQYVLAVDQS